MESCGYDGWLKCSRSVDLQLCTHGLSHQPVIDPQLQPPRDRPDPKVLLTTQRAGNAVNSRRPNERLLPISDRPNRIDNVFRFSQRVTHSSEAPSLLATMTTTGPSTSARRLRLESNGFNQGLVFLVNAFGRYTKPVSIAAVHSRENFVHHRTKGLLRQ